MLVGVSSSASSFKYLAWMLSGPVALWGLMFLSNLYTPFSVIVMFCIAEYGDGPLCGMFVWSSCVYTDLNWAFSISTISFASLCRYPLLSLNGDIPDASCFLLLIYCTIVYCCLLALDWWCRINTCYVPVWWFFEIVILVTCILPSLVQN